MLVVTYKKNLPPFTKVHPPEPNGNPISVNGSTDLYLVILGRRMVGEAKE